MLQKILVCWRAHAILLFASQETVLPQSLNNAAGKASFDEVHVIQSIFSEPRFLVMGAKIVLNIPNNGPFQIALKCINVVARIATENDIL